MNAALDRVHPGVLIVGGLAAVAITFGAFGLALLDDGSALDDLGLDSPPGRAAEGDSASGLEGTGAGGVGGDSLSEGLTTRDAGGGGGDSGSGAGGTGGDAAPDAGSPTPAGAGGSPAAAPPTSRPTTTSDSVPRTTAPSAPVTTAAPPSTPTTEPPHDGVIGGLLDLLGLG